MDSPRRSGLTDADRALWDNYAAQVRPLAGRTPTTPVLPPAATPSPRPRLTPPRTSHAPLPALAVGTQPGGMDTATWQRFRTGKLPVIRTLDLHGYTAQRAHHALTSFLRSAHAEGLRCVEVVTGQGGVLKRELPLWLNLPELRPLVLASAHPHPANPGSVRLLLRRAR